MLRYKRHYICLLLTALVIALFAPAAIGDNEHLYGGQAPEFIKRIYEYCTKLRKYLASEGDPVHLYGGEFYVTDSDVYIQGRMTDVLIERSYSSRSEYNGRFGYGWDMNYNIKVQKLKDPNSIILLTGDNRKLEYFLDPNSEPNEPFYRKEGLYDRLIANPDGTYSLIDKHSTKLFFNINGNLSSITDRNGNSVTFEYDPNGLMPLYGPSDFFLEEQFGGPADGRGLIAMSYRLVAIKDDFGRAISLSYDPNGLLSEVKDYTGRAWHYAYDNKNDLRSVTGPNTPDYPDGLTSSYTYDDYHNLLTATDPNGNTYLENQYDSSDRVFKQTYGYGDYVFDYLADSNSVTVTDRRGFAATTYYNNAGQPVRVVVDTNNLRDNEPDSYETIYEYNCDLEIVRQIMPAGNCLEYTYDSNGNVLSVCQKTDPNINEPNITVSYTYEPRFNFIKTATDERGYVTTYIYDYEDANNGNETGNLIRIIYPEVSTPDGDKNPVFSFSYDQYGQIETSTTAEGIVCKYIYYTDANDANNSGRLWKLIADYNQSDPCALNITTEYEYDSLSRTTEAKDPNGDSTFFEYDRLGRLTATTSAAPYSFITAFQHNKNSHILKTVSPVGDANQIVSFTYDALDNITKAVNPLGYAIFNTYDNGENLIDINDAEGNHTSYEYDARGLLYKAADANGYITQYSYTPNGDVNEIIDANGNIIRYEYDGFDRLTCVIYPDDTNEQFTYDAASNLIGFTNRKKQTTSYQYDALNRVVLKAPPDRPDITYQYDIAGRIVEVNKGSLITSYKYDRIGRVVEVKDIHNKTIGYEYDKRGLLTKLIYPDDSNVTYTYDSLSRLREIQYKGQPAAKYGYDELDRRTLVTLGNDSNAVYEYDTANRLTKLTNNLNDAGSTTITFEYGSFDKIGNRLSCTIDDVCEIRYSYDCRYQLIDVNYVGAEKADFSYDSLGNRIDANFGGDVNSYQINRLNQYSSVDSVVYSYDDNGNLINDGVFKYYYDSENRLTDVNDQTNSPIVSYEYDYLDRRVRKTDYTQYPVRITQYVYDGDSIIAEYDGNGDLLRKYIYSPAIDEPILIIDVDNQTENIYYYHFDGLGSIVALSNVNNCIVERYSYDAFGEPNRVSEIGNFYMFTGRRFDAETGLYYYRARYYQPELGRFIQPDPIGYVAGLNLYTYCDNDPVNFSDPSGLFKKLCIGTALDPFYSTKQLLGWNNPPDWDTFFANHPRIRKLWEGRYFGTGYGEQALDYYAHRIAFGQANAWDYAGGFFAAMWQPESWRTTSVTLGTAAYGSVKARIDARAVGQSQAAISKPLHGNNLNTTKPARGYSLRSKSNSEVLKYGETTLSEQRYSQKYLRGIDSRMKFEASGTKRQMHQWNHDMILKYKSSHGGMRPPLNKSDW
ncbi:MAG: hypothetical protein JW804_01345 [Sedimentisphaerales bacterium]|nr:hypothetical protein [Sedimentisphaerales bacterium]